MNHCSLNRQPYSVSSNDHHHLQRLMMVFLCCEPIFCEQIVCILAEEDLCFFCSGNSDWLSIHPSSKPTPFIVTINNSMLSRLHNIRVLLFVIWLIFCAIVCKYRYQHCFILQNDSGVDVSNMRLPDPPSSSNQVYALMQKIKNPLSEISKSLTRFAKKKKSLKTSDSSRKYENLNESTTSLYQTNLKTTKSGSSKLKKSSTLSLNQKSNDPYENTDFHTPRTPVPTSPQPLSPGVPILESTPSSPPFAELKDSKPDQSQSPFLEYNGTTPAVVPMPRKKKGAKSFKSKLRRSLVPDTSNLSAFNTNRSTFYISDSVDVDSGIFTGSDKTLKAEDSVSSLKLETSMVDLVNEIKSRNLKNTTTSSTEDVRRRSMSTSSRPLSPPPPPPTLMTQTSMDKKIQKPKRFGTTSWYDECGVFKEVKEVEKKNSQQSMTNWYADAGLYQTSGDSVASSSGSSGVSTGGECNGTDDNSHGLFSNEPLYQIYSAAKLEVRVNWFTN